MRHLRISIIGTLLLSTKVFGAQVLNDAIVEIKSDQPLEELPYRPGIDTRSIDPSTNPCEDFYQYSCGGWIHDNPIPPDQSRWTVTGKLMDDTKRYLWGILEQVAKDNPSLKPNQRKLGQFYSACMNEDKINKRGGKPLEKDWAIIENLHTKSDLPETLAKLKLVFGGSTLLEEGSNPFFELNARQDFDEPSKVIAVIEAGRLGLPDRELYSKNDAMSQKIKVAYVAHITKMFKKLGFSTQSSMQDAKAILRIETALEKAMLTQVDQRDPKNGNQKFDAGALRRLTPDFSWERYFRVLKIPEQKIVRVAEPLLLKELQKQWKKQSLSNLKAYLRWQIIRERAPILSKDYVQENFSFYGTTLNGVPDLPPRWRQCVQIVDARLGDLLGREYVDRTFNSETKIKVEQMTVKLVASLKDRIQKLDWMSQPTKEKALKKLSQIALKIGYPEKWLNYDSLQVDPDDYYGNVVRSNTFEVHRQLDKIGKPVDRDEWLMNAQMVGAYYNPQMNDINFTAAFLQPPFYDIKMDEAQKFGNTGAAIGHELVHGFDDNGRKLDGLGQLRDWWTAEDSQKFESKSQCLIDQYAQYDVVDGVKINSKLSIGEDIADLTGTILAFEAWKAEIGGKTAETRDGLTPEKRFFVGFAQWACGSHRAAAAKLQASTSMYAPSKYRVNGVVANMPEFREAFSCKVGQPMVKNKICEIW